jgi:hypothetical protein
MEYVTVPSVRCFGFLILFCNRVPYGWGCSFAAISSRGDIAEVGTSAESDTTPVLLAPSAISGASPEEEAKTVDVRCREMSGGDELMCG